MLLFMLVCEKMASPYLDRAKDTRKRLDSCWDLDLAWDKYPEVLNKGCSQVAKSMSVPPAAILGGLLLITSFIISPAVVTVPGTDWEEPALLWLTISMPTGSRKTTIYQFLRRLLQRIRQQTQCKESSPVWLLQDATFEKMGILMAENDGRLLALFDELSTFLTKIRLYSSRGLTDSHELSMFLELYNANPWTRTTGESNFSMKRTSLTVGGFNQPNVARCLIELPGNAEKGLSQRFLWLFPRPVYSEFDSLEPTDKVFTDKIVATLAGLWTKTAKNQVETKVFSLPIQDEATSIFKKKYDKVQNQLQCIAAMDDLMSGMLSKSMGQIIRVSAAMHVLFHLDNTDPLPDVITDSAIKAAIDFVEVCCQHTAYITGHGKIDEELEILKSDNKTTGPVANVSTGIQSNEAFVLLLPGKQLDVSFLVNQKKKFRNRGGREGALQAIENLQNAGIGKLAVKKSKGSVTTWMFHKVEVPEEQEKKSQLAQLLSKYNISLMDYIQSLNDEMEEMNNRSTLGKRSASDEAFPTSSEKRAEENIEPTSNRFHSKQSSSATTTDRNTPHRSMEEGSASTPRQLKL